MTVNEFAKFCETPLKCISGYKGKILCDKFDPNEHIEIGQREIYHVWATITVTDSAFENYAKATMCCYVDGSEEYEKEMKNNDK